MNMSYCRFQNTLEDLRDCADNLDDRDLSPDEWEARRRLIDTCVFIAKHYGDERVADEDTPPDRTSLTAAERAHGIDGL